MQKLARQIVWFVVVGSAAAATHWLAVVALVSTLNLDPLVANLAGWLVAFGVSFTGHFQLTFKFQRASMAVAARRFFVVSAAGFGANQVAYAWLLHATTLRYDYLLALILIGIAGMTFILGRVWAFRHTP